ncbi:hypothetical protein NMU03_12005 [Allocoprobacillus halotolerans]|uniref:Uncharacterized protein n=1 Tax=Allocoprobacillus halotolerans TaxID=2944914 RepID=A0ABY5HZ73_9FIRM|nr:hypothetical protein [Allocoprobacillus halotolerans]UTY38382.1 hypothetical protein NMU03_12005 [Allocoprobacillus halotolerans]
MQDFLKMYYHIDCYLETTGYFYVGQQLYYLSRIQDPQEFFNRYHYYRYLMHQCGIRGYEIVKNIYQELLTQDYVLLLYQKDNFSREQYIHQTMVIYPFPKLKVQQIKEQWICKIDQAREKVKDYAYSFKHDQDILSLIYYYCGLAENSINILNYLLQVDNQASLPVSLSLSQPVFEYVYELLNPCSYIFSTRMRHLSCLMKSQLLTYDQLQNLLETHYFDVYEIIYFYARMLYPSYFFECLFQESLDEKIINFFISN